MTKIKEKEGNPHFKEDYKNIQTDPSIYASLCEESRNDFRIAQYAVLKNYEAYMFFPEKLKNDLGSFSTILENHQYGEDHKIEYLMEHCPEQFKEDRDCALMLLEETASVFPYLSAELRNDRDIVEIAIEQNGKYFKFISDDLKKDINLCVLAVASNYKVFSEEILIHQKENAVTILEELYKQNITDFFYVKEMLEVDSSFPDFKDLEDEINDVFGQVVLEKPEDDFYVEQWNTAEKSIIDLLTETDEEEDSMYLPSEGDVNDLIEQETFWFKSFEHMAQKMSPSELNGLSSNYEAIDAIIQRYKILNISKNTEEAKKMKYQRKMK